MALQDSYDSTLTKLVKTPTILLDIKKSVLLSQLKQYSPQIEFITEDQTEVPLFIHPLYNKEGNVVYLDARPYTSIERNGEMKIRSEYDYQLNLMRAKLELAWQLKDRNDLYAGLDFANQIFVRWLSETICHRYGLIPIQQVKVMAVVAMFSIGQYFNTIEDELTINRYLQMISRNYMLDATTVVGVAELLENQFPRDIEEFISALHRLDVSPRLKEFNQLVLFNMLSGSWYMNSNHMQIVSLGLEFPPAFAALVYMATQYSVYKRCGIGQRVDKANRHNAHATFVRQLATLVGDYDKE